MRCFISVQQCVYVCPCVCVSLSLLLEKPQDCSSPPSSSPPPAVKISSILPECHMWCTLMRCIFNPADLLLQKFPLPVQQRNGSQMQHVLRMCVRAHVGGWLCTWCGHFLCVCVCLASVFVSLFLTLSRFG